MKILMNWAKCGHAKGDIMNINKLIRALRNNNKLFDGTNKQQQQIERLILKCKDKLKHNQPSHNNLNGCIICLTD